MGQTGGRGAAAPGPQWDRNADSGQTNFSERRRTVVWTPSGPLGAQSPRFCEEPALRGVGRPEAMHAHGERDPDGGGPGTRGPAREGPTGEGALGCGLPPPPPLRGSLASSSPPLASAP